MGNVPSFISASNELQRRLTRWNQSAEWDPAGLRGRGGGGASSGAGPSAAGHLVLDGSRSVRLASILTGGRKEAQQVEEADGGPARPSPPSVQSGSFAGTSQLVAPPTEKGRLINAANAANWLPAAPAHMNN